MDRPLEAPRTTRVTGSDGVEVAVHRWGVPGDLPPVFLQHGFVADTVTNWQVNGIVPALLAAGREVVGVDVRGHGRSDEPHDPARYGEARMAEDVRRVADALGDGVGADRPALAAQARVVHAGPIPLDRVTAPTLVLAGDADPLAVRPEVLAGAVPRARLTLVPGDHLGAVASAQFAVGLVDFLGAA